MYTEEEAKTKWCPKALSDSELGGSFNRHFQDNTTAGNTNCLCSDCMAWRWVWADRPLPDGGLHLGGQQTTKGYCGLAGEPDQ